MSLEFSEFAAGNNVIKRPLLLDKDFIRSVHSISGKLWDKVVKQVN